MGEPWLFWTLAGAAAAVWAARIVAARRRRATNRVGAATSKELRAQVLGGTRSSLLQPAAVPGASAFGALMELGLPGAAASLVALRDGTTSLYVSSGGGAIGGGANPEVRRAAQTFLETAESLRDELAPTAPASRAGLALPAAEHVAFVLLSDGGLRRAEVATQTLESGQHPLSALYLAGHAVLTALREATAHAPA